MGKKGKPQNSCGTDLCFHSAGTFDCYNYPLKREKREVQRREKSEVRDPTACSLQFNKRFFKVTRQC